MKTIITTWQDGKKKTQQRVLYIIENGRKLKKAKHIGNAIMNMLGNGVLKIVPNLKQLKSVLTIKLGMIASRITQKASQSVPAAENKSYYSFTSTTLMAMEQTTGGSSKQNLATTPAEITYLTGLKKMATQKASKFSVPTVTWANAWQKTAHTGGN